MQENISLLEILLKRKTVLCITGGCKYLNCRDKLRWYTHQTHWRTTKKKPCFLKKSTYKRRNYSPESKCCFLKIFLRKSKKLEKINEIGVAKNDAKKDLTCATSAVTCCTSSCIATPFLTAFLSRVASAILKEQKNKAVFQLTKIIFRVVTHNHLRISGKTWIIGELKHKEF